jgi:hypothetical protein
MKYYRVQYTGGQVVALRHHLDGWQKNYGESPDAPWRDDSALNGAVTPWDAAEILAGEFAHRERDKDNPAIAHIVNASIASIEVMKK